MKVGIVTNYEWLKQWGNYGTLFQNYALQEVLRDLGHESYWIRTTNSRPFTFSERCRNLGLKLLTNPSELLKQLKGEKHLHADISPANPRIIQFNADHHRSFEEFMSSHLGLSEREYGGEELRHSPPEADAFIVGSDNVWAQVSPAYFLQFGSASTKRIAYAVSSNWETLSPYWYARARKAIRSIDHVSVREDAGLHVCKKLGRGDAAHVLDPTLLAQPACFRKLLPLASVPEEDREPTLLVYWLNAYQNSDWPLREMERLAEAKSLKLQIIPLQGTELLAPEIHTYVPNPSSWLDAFANAECVLTNSFHGTAFSIIFNRPFVVLPKSKDPQAHGSERFRSLLGKLDLESRIIHDRSYSSLTRVLEEQIDWESVETKLASERSKSLDFLKRALVS
ncbi:polysaccharide pyruvyl transferase family protein [Coraliomargarita algicola]|uniref:Polysaccharide pyruvyl transferase family protein n=1 Tax=Coraliomargarita algicola TaxID=3092156 RepID=A0ABZ0RFR7_9BACT|nr:polysaccharide pyruvyl transferase family protein [Coraliomargarita sp. J2-16]WPJ95010.1 polysaccharide pyruvyl transferase family protein [Coraliomargarita sp. J2-16]